jgi:hypothetical protein
MGRPIKVENTLYNSVAEAARKYGFKPEYNYGVTAYKLAKAHLRMANKHAKEHKKVTGKEAKWGGKWRKAAYENQNKYSGKTK